MYWSNESTGVVGGVHGIFRTSDGGQTWTEVLDERCSTMAFSDNLNGAAGSYFEPGAWITEDGGQTWTFIDSAWVRNTEVVATTEGGFLVGSAGSVIQRLIPFRLIFADGFEVGDTGSWSPAVR